MKFESKEIFTIAGSALAYLLFVILLFTSGLSVSSLVNLQNSLLKSAILGSSGLNAVGALSLVLQPFATIFFALLLLTLYFSFLTAYGFFSSEKYTGLIAGSVAALMTVIVFHSLLSLFLAAALLLTSPYVILLSNTYAKELKKWVKFRVGSNAAAKALLLFNVLLALGIFLVVFSNSQFYQTSFKTDLTNNLQEITLASLPDIATVPGAVTPTKEQISQQVAAALADSPMFNAYLVWLPVLSAVGVWFLLELLRNLILSNVAGLLSYVFTKFHEKRMS